jgi:hypothetical protein
MQINQEFIVKFNQYQSLIKREYCDLNTSSNQHVLQRSVTFIKEYKSPSDQTSIENSNSTFATEDALLFNFLLLDSAAVCQELRCGNSLESLEMLCMAWSIKSNDVFDSCLQLLKNYWAR